MPCSISGTRRTRSAVKSAVLCFFLVLAGPSPSTAAAPWCVGDCNGNDAVTVDELLRGVNRALGDADPSACPAADVNLDGAVTIDELVRAVRHALNGCPPDRIAFITATDFQTGSFADVSVTPPYTAHPADPHRRTKADAVVRTHRGLLYVVNRFLGDNIQVLDPAGDFATIVQCSTGPGTNPHDIAFAADGRAYVTLYDTATLLVVDPSVRNGCDGFVLDRIDLSEFADADGIPEMDQAVVLDGVLYVAIQLLDRNAFFSPAGPAALVLIDTATNRPVGEIPLHGGNPNVATKGLTVWDGKLLIGETGHYGVLDGGIEAVDPVTRTAKGFLITEEELGGDIGDFVIVSSHLGYAVTVNPDYTTRIVTFDPSLGSLTEVLFDSIEYVPDIELNDRGKLFFADRTPGHSGIRILRASDGTELTRGVIPLGLPPFEIVFLK